MGSVTCGDVPSLESSVPNTSDFATSRLKAVWIQDMGDGSDFEAQGTTLRLMGFDSNNERGSFILSGDIGNYARPLITRKGDRVVYSNRKSSEVYIIDWDGSNRRIITHGLGVAVWIDPETETEWIYVARPGPNTDSTGWPMGSIWRYPIDTPADGVLVWDKTDIDVDNFQVSADGTRSGGLFPWPFGGEARLPNGSWIKYGEGCWTSFAPDNSYKLWIFDGNHREVTLYDAGGVHPRTIDLSRLPGIDGHEVNHPRWSNSTRFFSFSGPYEMREGDDRNSANHENVEIFIGRFDEGFTKVEELVQLTSNTRADYFPDIWIQPENSAGSIAGTEKPSTMKNERTEEVSSLDEWSVDTDRLVFIWKNRMAPNQIFDSSGEYVYTCNVEPRGKAWFGDFYSMSLRGGAFIAPDMEDIIRNECITHSALTIELVLHQFLSQSVDTARVISYGSANAPCNFELIQQGNILRFRLLCSNSSGSHVGNVEFPISMEEVYQHLLITYMPGNLMVYRNGTPIGARTDITGDFSAWTSGTLIFGNSIHHDLPWNGNIEGVAISARYIKENEVTRRAGLYLNEIEARTPSQRLSVEARLIDAGTVPDPTTIFPYRRALSVRKYEIESILSGDYDDRYILVAHWSILDGHVIHGKPSELNSLHRLILEPYENHPELEPERLIMDTLEFEIPLFYDVETPTETIKSP